MVTRIEHYIKIGDVDYELVGGWVTEVGGVSLSSPFSFFSFGTKSMPSNMDVCL